MVREVIDHGIADLKKALDIIRKKGESNGN